MSNSDIPQIPTVEQQMRLQALKLIMAHEREGIMSNETWQDTFEDTDIVVWYLVTGQLKGEPEEEPEPEVKVKNNLVSFFTPQAHNLPENS